MNASAPAPAPAPATTASTTSSALTTTTVKADHSEHSVEWNYIELGSDEWPVIILY